MTPVVWAKFKVFHQDESDPTNERTESFFMIKPKVICPCFSSPVIKTLRKIDHLLVHIVIIGLSFRKKQEIAITQMRVRSFTKTE